MISQVAHKPAYRIVEFDEVVGQGERGYYDLVRKDHYETLWTYAANCILALYLITSPFLFDYKSPALTLSDTVSGALIIIFELLAFSPRRAFLRLGTPLVAFWLLFAPLIFWSPTPAVYLTDTLIACLVIVFSILVPGMPGKGGIDLPGPDRPPGWTYNPSSWIRRWLGVGLALLGFLISRYLACHQLGYLPHAYDPFFGSGTDKVTGSAVSRSFPISDAGFGAVAYMMEVLTGFMGDRARWRTAPWIAVMFALLVLPLGVTSIVLVVLQPIAVGAWCGLCLISAAALLTSVPLAVHEAVAVGQFLVAARAQKKNLWQVFWMGATITGGGTQDPDRTHYSFGQRWIESVRGVTVPVTLAAQLAIGIWLMASPDLFPFDKTTANCDHLLGAMIVTVAAVATAEVTRIARFANIILGIVLTAAAFIFARHELAVFASEFISGLAVALLALPRGRIAERYSTWDRFVK